MLTFLKKLKYFFIKFYFYYFCIFLFQYVDLSKSRLVLGLCMCKIHISIFFFYELSASYHFCNLHVLPHLYEYGIKNTNIITHTQSNIYTSVFVFFAYYVHILSFSIENMNEWVDMIYIAWLTLHSGIFFLFFYFFFQLCMHNMTIFT